jgi:hypothetical protein
LYVEREKNVGKFVSEPVYSGRMGSTPPPKPPSFFEQFWKGPINSGVEYAAKLDQWRKENGIDAPPPDPRALKVSTVVSVVFGVAAVVVGVNLIRASCAVAEVVGR